MLNAGNKLQVRHGSFLTRINNPARAGESWWEEREGEGAQAKYTATLNTA